MIACCLFEALSALQNGYTAKQATLGTIWLGTDENANLLARFLLDKKFQCAFRMKRVTFDLLLFIYEITEVKMSAKLLSLMALLYHQLYD